MTRLEVIHSTPVWLPQTQTWMFEQARHLPAEVRCHVVCDRTENLDQFPMPDLHSRSDGPRWRALCDRALRLLGVRRHPGLLVEVARGSGARLLHSHFGHIGWRDLGAAHVAGLRHLVSFYGQDLSLLPRLDPRWHARYGRLFEAVDRVLCEGPHMAESLARLGCPPAKITIQRLGVRLDRFAFSPRVFRPGETLKVLLCGSFTEKKGLPDALSALGLLAAEMPLEITLIGDANDKPRNLAEKQRILSVIARERLAPRLLGLCPHARILEEAYRHHVFLSPSVTASDGDTEGGAPVTILELAATGMPIVSTRHCDIPDILPEGTGLLAEEHDVSGLAAHLRWLVHHPESWAERCERARAHLQGAHDATRQGEALARIYQEVRAVSAAARSPDRPRTPTPPRGHRHAALADGPPASGPRP